MKTKYKHPEWKRTWLNASGGICMIFGFLTLITVIVDYLQKIPSCKDWYGAAASIAFILFAATFMFYNKAEERK
jgi:hypothetical protein